MLEKGRWSGPAQIIIPESRPTVWITHFNRLLRCATENIQPVSLREFQQPSLTIQTSSQDQLQQMANQLQRQLVERSGLFQYSDLSDIPAENQEEPNEPKNQESVAPSENRHEIQPEEEPNRQISVNLQHVNDRLAQAQGTPVPDTPMSHVPEDAAAATTASLETDDEVNDTDHNMEPVYSATRENWNFGDITIENDGVTWNEPEEPELACASFAFDVPQQHLQKFLRRPREHLPCLTVAAKKSKNEVVYSDLSKAEQELFKQAKQKELKCWLDTSTVKAIVRDRSWILTWKQDLNQPTGRKVKARLVVKGLQDPDIDNLCSGSPNLTRHSRMPLLQTISSMKWVVFSLT